MIVATRPFNIAAQGDFIRRFPIIEQGLTIREMEERDIAPVQAIITHNPDFDFWCFKGANDDAANFVKEAIQTQRFEAGQLRTNFMMAVDAGGQFVGHVSADLMHDKPDHLDVAYFIDPAQKGKGLATLAARTMISHIFSALRVPAVIATAKPKNAPSIKILENIGFIRTGMTEVDDAKGDRPRIAFKLDCANFKR